MRFLLVSSGRSGTHMLRSIFRAHPDVAAWHDYQGRYATRPGALPTELAEYYKRLDPDATVGAMEHFHEAVFRRCPPDPAAWHQHWTKLRRIHNRVIVLTRDDVLGQYLSVSIANRDLTRGDYAAWASERPRQTHPEPLLFDMAAFRYHVTRLTSAQQQVRALLSTYFAVRYEDLVERWEDTVRGIYEHLGLRWNDPVPATHKQETRPYSEIVANWDEVHGALREMGVCE